MMVLLECLLQLSWLKVILISNDSSIRSMLNSTFWLSCFLGVVFIYFKHLFKLLLRVGHVQGRQFSQIVHYLWNICFYAAAVVFLTLYHMLLIWPEVIKGSANYFPKTSSAIFATVCDAGTFELITLVLVAFEVFCVISNFTKCDYSETLANALYGALLVSCFSLRLENYSLLLNFYTSVYRTIRESLLLCASLTNATHRARLTILAVLMFCTWFYLFLNLLPFEFLIPTLHARKENFALKLCFGLWYCSCIWNSPLLKLLYHKIYHTYPNDCAGEGSTVRCIMSDDWQNVRHFRNLEHAFYDLKLHQSHESIQSGQASENTTAAAFQTIKCVMALKRKLKLLRERRAQARIDSHT
ncbi:uncharacterized protein LOC131213678 [Anopheles bellator]|uniref:uncharacterized protein LOC131213678 n=1 Tax=Anopheles bellator TaxID=139047 RepID=UPI002648E608|nr:uncharacterized protein LOC131213678 [Anopheles bellator]